MPDFLAFDTETYPIAPGCLAPRMVCLSASNHSASSVLLNPHYGLELINDVFKTGETVVAHNLPFDLAVCIAARPDLLLPIFEAYRDGRLADTMTAAKLIAIASGHRKWSHDGKPSKFSLAACVEREFGETVAGKGEDGWRLRYGELDDLPISAWPTEAVEYARNDASYCARLWQKLEPRLRSIAPDALWRLELQAQWALHLGSCHGVRTDGAAVATLKAQLETHVNARVAELTGVVYRANGTLDKKAVQARVIAALGEAAPRTPSGGVSTDKETLFEAGKQDPVLATLAEISGDRKLLNTYVPLLERGTVEPINPSYDSPMESFRTSSFNPNIQNQPRKPGVRECFIARSGCVLIACDYSIAELRSLSALLLKMYGASAMAEAILAGRDLHLDFAAQWLGISYDQAVSEKETKRVTDARQIAKVANFGFPGGMGSDTLIQSAHDQFRKDDGTLPDWLALLTPDLSAQLRQAWLQRFPEMALYFQDVAAWVGAGGGSYTDIHSITGFVRGNCSFCQGANQGFQHLTAYGAKRALWQHAWEAYCEPDSPLYGSRLWAFVHDELIIECVESRASAAADRLEALMCEAMAPVTPGIPVVTDAHIMRRWSKQAKAVRDVEGRLIPWQP